MRVLRDGYVGIAPVPRGRVNVGIVLGRSWRRALAEAGAQRVVERIVAAIPATPDDPADWRTGAPCEAIAGAAPIGHRVTRRAGPGLVPRRGRGRVPRSVHRRRAPSSARLGRAGRDGDRRGAGRAPLRRRRLRAGDARRFAAKDRVSWLVQAFLGRPALFEYAARRLADRAAVRETVGLVMGDLLPAERALEPRLLLALLAP